MDTIGLLTRFVVVALLLTATLTTVGGVAGAAESSENESAPGGESSGYERKSVTTDKPASGIILGIGLFAVVLGGIVQLGRE